MLVLCIFIVFSQLTYYDKTKCIKIRPMKKIQHEKLTQIKYIMITKISH